ncbi:MAG TPA: ribonuclease H-like domain-containing protein [Candidatus Paceibacterota bacterium]|nr:ribonuclease H-like domain-containing protein [Candidatus Paceibacterota bacterium]
MPKLIFDIETVGVEFDSLDDKSQELLLRFAETPEDIMAVKEGLGFSPLTGQIVAIGVLNPETAKGAVYFLSPDDGVEKQEKDGVQYIPHKSEKDLLKSFWDASAHYDQFITFNGRGFDAPYLMIRSAINKIKPAKNLMTYRYESEQYGKIITHLDLLDRLTFFGAVRRKGGLHMWCRAFDIKSPKSEGVSGEDVARLFKDKEYMKIAEYCFDDVLATEKLYEYWEKYINIK